MQKPKKSTIIILALSILALTLFIKHYTFKFSNGIYGVIERAEYKKLEEATLVKEQLSTTQGRLNYIDSLLKK